MNPGTCWNSLEHRATLDLLSMWLLLPPPLRFQRPFIPHDRKDRVLHSMPNGIGNLFWASGCHRKVWHKCDKSICKTPSCISVMVLDFQVVAAYDNSVALLIWFQPNNSRNNPLGLPLHQGSLVLAHSCVLLPHLVVALFLSPVMSSLFTSLSATNTEA